QSSGPMLPSAAEMPPCAATVWERVGKTLEMQAVLRPDWAQPTLARNPAPPAPTTTTSNVWSVIGYAAPASAGAGCREDLLVSIARSVRVPQVNPTRSVA